LNSSVRRSVTFANRRNLDNIKQLLQNRPQLPRIPENGIRWFPSGRHHMARVFLPTVRASGIAVMYSVDQAVPAEQIAATLRGIGHTEEDVTGCPFCADIIAKVFLRW
jgi:hypothetical protein